MDSAAFQLLVPNPLAVFVAQIGLSFSLYLADLSCRKFVSSIKNAKEGYYA